MAQMETEVKKFYSILIFTVSACSGSDSIILDKEKNLELSACDERIPEGNFSLPKKDDIDEYKIVIEKNIDKLDEDIDGIYHKNCALAMSSSDNKKCFFLIRKIPTPGGGAKVCYNERFEARVFLEE